MITRREYKVLKAIRDVNGADYIPIDRTPYEITKNNILTHSKGLKEYEVNEALCSLEKAEMIVDILNYGDNPLYNARITDSGLCALKDYKGNLFKKIMSFLHHICEIVFS